MSPRPPRMAENSGVIAFFAAALAILWVAGATILLQALRRLREEIDNPMITIDIGLAGIAVVALGFLGLMGWSLLHKFVDWFENGP